MKQTLLLAMPNSHDIYQTIHDNLRYHGFDVITCLEDSNGFRYPNLSLRLKAKLRQILLHDKHAKRDTKSFILQQNLQNIIQQKGDFDNALFIRGDLFSPELIQFVRQHTRHSVINYQWDGMKRYADIWDNVPYFDRFFVFDPQDIQPETPLFLPSTNFYFDHNLNQQPEIEYDCYFTGWHLPNRNQSIVAFAEYAAKHNLTLNFTILYKEKGQTLEQGRQLYPADNIQLSQTVLSFNENLLAAQKAKILLDFKNPYHNGLSFRPFEALGYRKKLITTHPDIVKYDFYHPNNIFVWDGTNLEDLSNFLAMPYYEIAPEIREKYSFGNWIKYVLNIEPHQKISLPK